MQAWLTIPIIDGRVKSCVKEKVTFQIRNGLSGGIALQSGVSDDTKDFSISNNLAMKFVLSATIVMWSIKIFSQITSAAPLKPIVDSTKFFNWPSILDWPRTVISNNGQFILYAARNIQEGKRCIVMQTVQGNEKITLQNVRKAAFTGNSRYAVFLQAGDSVCLLKLSDKRRSYFTGTSDFTLFTLGDSEWLAYSVRGPDKKLVLKNINTGAEKCYFNLDNYELSHSSKSMVLQSPLDSNKDVSLRWVDLLTNTTREIWKGKNLSSITLNKEGSQLAFLGDDSNTGGRTIWLYSRGDEKATRTSLEVSTVLQEMELDVIEGFNKEGDKLLVQLKEKSSRMKQPKLVPLNVWSYTDAKLQSEQLREVTDSGPNSLAVIDIAGVPGLRRLQLAGESVSAQSDSLLIVSYRCGDLFERYWNKAALSASYIVNINSGNRTKIPISSAAFSPKTKYVIGYGRNEVWGEDVYIYEVATGMSRNITRNLGIPEQGYDEKILWSSERRNLVVAGWLKDESAVLVYDNYDIWQVDPTGILPPLNLTGGRKDKWIYRLDNNEIINGVVVTTKRALILTAFNTISKKSGFFKLSLGKAKRPERLFIGDYCFQEMSTPNGISRFLKARDASIYVVRRESAMESPNIFLTADFKNFTRISKVEPERSVNWLTTELINIYTTDSLLSQAILYKPEYFDSSKKYPMIIQYYQTKSDELNRYTTPVVDNGGELDVPWFVSRGYLVLKPDIRYTEGEPGASALKSVEAAANYMINRSYIDKQRIGIQGHSFGGYETNYIVTHSDMFAAAMSSAGVSNVASDFGNVWPGDNSRQEYWETRDGYIGTTPWEHPSTYVKNSPVFNIGRVTAPVLMLHNRNDKNVHFEEGLQFFTGLRRAGKRCWMLEYDNGGHGVGGDDYKDCLIRMTQFFDHYLKGAPAPRWMMYGIPAKDKGYDDGMELVMEKDASGNWVTPSKGGLLREDLQSSQTTPTEKPNTP